MTDLIVLAMIAIFWIVTRVGRRKAIARTVDAFQGRYEPDGWIRRTRPTVVRAFSTSYTACRDTSGRRVRTAPKIVSVSACGCAHTASSTAIRGRVTRRSAIRS